MLNFIYHPPVKLEILPPQGLYKNDAEQRPPPGLLKVKNSATLLEQLLITKMEGTHD